MATSGCSDHSVGAFYLGFLLGFGEVTVGKADSSNPSHVISVRTAEFRTLDKVSKAVTLFFPCHCAYP